MTGKDTLEAAYYMLTRTCAATTTPFTLEKALLVAECFHQQDEPILVNTIKVSLRQLMSGYYPKTLANLVRIKFYGGPVGHGKWFEGTVWSFILDTVAVSIQTQGYQKTLQLLRAKLQ